LRFWPSVGATPDKAHQREYAKSDLFYDKQFHNENEIQLMAGKQDEASDRRFPSEMIKAETPTFSEHGNKGEITFTWLVPMQGLVFYYFDICQQWCYIISDICQKERRLNFA
ncbi:MAG: hypothetical protein K6D38_03110, partial [Pseudobutyrivibrio sp.]|nr:hypothetical protein [Pseudobutyrivibrio sp.]